MGVLDRKKKRFGGLFTGKFEMRENFWGTGESFLFELEDEGVTIYPATMKNNLFCFSDENGFGMGSR